MKTKYDNEFKWKFMYDPKKLLLENILNYISKASLSTLVLFTDDKIKNKNNTRYKIKGVSMSGQSNSLIEPLKNSRLLICKYLKLYVKGDDIFEEKMMLLDEILYEIEKFLVDHSPTGYYLPDLLHKVKLFSESENEVTEVDLSKVLLSDDHMNEIRNHLNIRAANFIILRRFVNLQKTSLEFDHKYKPHRGLKEDKIKLKQIYEVWFALKELGFMNHVKDRTVEMVALRAEFFKVFGLKEKNFQAIAQEMLRKKKPHLDLLPRLVSAFYSASKKYK